MLRVGSCKWGFFVKSHQQGRDIPGSDGESPLDLQVNHLIKLSEYVQDIMPLQWCRQRGHLVLAFSSLCPCPCDPDRMQDWLSW